MSTSMAIMESVENITNAMDNGKLTIGVFIDLKKAFDTVDHSILVTKLDHNGIRGVAKKWLSSYLENRKQYVCFNGTDSGFLPITCGVPQGSIDRTSVYDHQHVVVDERVPSGVRPAVYAGVSPPSHRLVILR